MRHFRRLATGVILAALCAGPALAQELIPGTDDVYRIGDGVEPPTIVERERPNYTDEALDAELEGIVVLSAEIHPDGRVHNIEIREHLGKGLDESASKALSKWRFNPARLKGEPVKVKAIIQIRFRLEPDDHVASERLV